MSDWMFFVEVFAWWLCARVVIKEVYSLIDASLEPKRQATRDESLLAEQRHTETAERLERIADAIEARADEIAIRAYESNEQEWELERDGEEYLCGIRC